MTDHIGEWLPTVTSTKQGPVPGARGSDLRRIFKSRLIPRHIGVSPDEFEQTLLLEILNELREANGRARLTRW